MIFSKVKNNLENTRQKGEKFAKTIKLFVFS